MTMKNNYIVFIGVLNILFNSCSDTILINGTYSKKHSPYVLTFSKDSTFIYESRKGCYAESFGTWKTIGDVIYLNSLEQIDKMPVEYTKIKGNKKNTIINVKLNVPDKPQRDYICFPYVNGEFVFMYPERGSYSFESEVPIDSICFLIAKKPFVLRGTGNKGCYDDVWTESIYLYSLVGESIDITINIIDSLFGYKVFKNEKIEIKNGKIIFKAENKKHILSLKE